MGIYIPILNCVVNMIIFKKCTIFIFGVMIAFLSGKTAAKQEMFNPKVTINELAFRPNYEILNESGTSTVSRGVLGIDNSHITTRHPIKFALWESRNLDPSYKKLVEKYKIRFDSILGEFSHTLNSNTSTIDPSLIEIYINNKPIKIGDVEEISNNLSDTD